MLVYKETPMSAVTKAQFENAGKTSIRATIDGREWTQIYADHPLWSEVVAEVERTKNDPEPFIIAPYVEPTESTEAKKAKILAERDMRTLQRLNYQRQGKDTAQVDAKLAALDAQLAAL